jgi:hypothetical protein
MKTYYFVFKSKLEEYMIISVNGNVLPRRCSTANGRKFVLQYVALFLFQEMKVKGCGLAAETCNIRVNI